MGFTFIKFFIFSESSVSLFADGKVRIFLYEELLFLFFSSFHFRIKGYMSFPFKVTLAI